MPQTPGGFKHAGDGEHFISSRGAAIHWTQLPHSGMTAALNGIPSMSSPDVPRVVGHERWSEHINGQKDHTPAHITNRNASTPADRSASPARKIEPLGPPANNPQI
jgi:hypothetical protein